MLWTPADDPRAFMDVYPVGVNTNLYMPWHPMAKARLPVDLFVATMPHGAREASALASTRNRRIPGLARCESGIHPAKGNMTEYVGTVNKSDASGEMFAGASLGIHHVFLSEADRDATVDLFWRPHLSSSALRGMFDRTRVIPNGVDLRAVEPSTLDRGRSVGSFYAVKDAKGTPKLLALYAQMFRAGQVDRVTVTQGADVDITPYTGGVAMDHHPLCGRSDYLQHASMTACAVWNSDGESSPIAPVEAAAAGCVPIFPNRPWFTQWDTGAWPLVYDSLDEVPGIVAMVLRNRDAWSERSIAWARRYDGAIHGRAFMEHCANVATGHDLVARMSDEEFDRFMGGRYGGALRELFAREAPVEWADVLTVPPPWAAGNALITPADTVSMIRRAFPAWKDDMNSPIPRWTP